MTEFRHYGKDEWRNYFSLNEEFRLSVIPEFPLSALPFTPRPPRWLRRDHRGPKPRIYEGFR